MISSALFMIFECALCTCTPFDRIACDSHVVAKCVPRKCAIFYGFHVWCHICYKILLYEIQTLELWSCTSTYLRGGSDDPIRTLTGQYCVEVLWRYVEVARGKTDVLRLAHFSKELLSSLLVLSNGVLTHLHQWVYQGILVLVTRMRTSPLLYECIDSFAK